MRPPECEVCGERFAPADGALIRFLRTEKGRSFEARLEEEGCSTGDHPDEACALLKHRHALVTPEQRQEDQRPLLQALSAQLQSISGVRTFDDAEVAAFFIVKATEAIAVSAATEMRHRLEDGTVAAELTRMLLAYVRPEVTS